MTDYISRQSAIREIQAAYIDTQEGFDKAAVNVNVGLTKALHIMQDMPSSTPDLESAYAEGYTAAESRYMAFMAKQSEMKEENGKDDLIKRSDAIDAVCYAEDGKDAQRIIKNLPSEQRWIPVSKRLPEDGAYLVYAPTYTGGSSGGKEWHDGVMFSKFKNGKWSVEHGYHKRPGCVKAWMPLPEPYVED